MSTRARARFFHTSAPAPAPPPAPPSNPDQLEMSWTGRASAPWILTTERFTSAAAVAAVRFPDANQANVVWEQTTKRSGAGALRINVPASMGQGTGSVNISSGGLRGNGTTTYYQFQLYVPDVMLRHKPAYNAGNGGWKAMIISSWSSDFSLGSFTENEVVVNNQDWRGFPLGYHHNGSGFVNFDGEVNTPCENPNYRYTTAIDAGTPASPATCSQYEQRYGVLWHNPDMPNLGIPSQESDVIAAGFPSPHALASGAVPWTRDGWTVIMFKVQIGTLGSSNSTIEMWACQPGGQYVLMHRKTSVLLGTENGGHLGVWLTPFDTARIANSSGVVDGYFCYAELAISSQWIPEPAGTFTPPYTLPDPGATLAIGTNTAYSITPPGMTTTQWSYALFNNFGRCVLVEDYSAGGALAHIGGGHGVSHQTGVAIFDLNDATWKRRAPSDTTQAYGGSDFNVADTTGSPHYFISGTTVPAPGHGYQNVCAVPKAMGGGSQGSVAYIVRSAVCNESVTSQWSYSIDLATGVWSLLSTGARVRVTSADQSDGACVLDRANKRWWYLPVDQNVYGNHQYLDATDRTWKVTTSYGSTPSGAAEGSLFTYGSLLLRQGQSGGLFAWDIDSPASGWTQLTVSGSLPSTFHTPFEFFPPHNSFYWMPTTGGGTLTRLRPPTGATSTAALLSGTWTVSSASISPAVPSRTSDGGGPTSSHYGSMLFAPALQRLVWVPGGNESVYLIYPPAP